MADVLLGADGGGSGCRVELCDISGETIATATGGPANVTSDFDGAIRNLRAAINAVMVETGVDADRVTAHLGLAGMLDQTTADRVANALGLARCSVSDDRATALAGALQQGDGVLLALGTGTIMAARDGADTRFVSGWGLILSDRASGGWLGRELLARTLLAHDGLVPQTDLSREVLSEMGGPQGIVAFAQGAQPPDYAALAPRLFGSSEDATAQAIIGDAIAHLCAALKVLDPSGGLDICLGGGVGPRYAAWLEPGMQARLVAPKGTPLDGALFLARATLLKGTA